MKKRRKADSEFILKGDKSIGAVGEWTNELFHRKEAKDFGLPKEALEWFLEVAFCAYEKAENDLVKRMILVKIIHTREVVKAGFDIVRAEKEFVWNDNQVGAVCLLHDVGRFDQALLGSYSDEKTEFDHALRGAEMMRDHDFNQLYSRGIAKESVIEAIKYHSAYKYEGNDLYAKLIRDADKLALLRAMPEILAVNIGEFAEKRVTKAALRSYKGGEMVHNGDMKTKADLFLAWLGWEFDLNFSSTRKFFVDEGIKEWMKKELILLNVKV